MCDPFPIDSLGAAGENFDILIHSKVIFPLEIELRELKKLKKFACGAI